MFALIGIAMLLVYALLVFYIGWSGWSWMKPVVSTRFRILYIIAITFLASSFLLGRLFGNSAFLSMIGSYWMAAFSLLIILLPIVHLSLWLIRLTRLRHHELQKWAGAATLVIFLGLMGYGSFNAYSPVVRNYDIQLDKPAGDLDALNIVMVSDMHYGGLSGAAHARQMVEEIQALQPDLVLYAGDIIDDDLSAYLNSGIHKIMAEVKAPLGVYAVLGNHDKDKNSTRELIESLEDSHIQVLHDESIQIGNNLTLIGRKDRIDDDRAELSELIKDVDLTQPVLLMDHQPYDLDIAEQQGVDVMLSGHTHRGQIAPFHLITGAIYENDWGHLQKNSFHSIVSSGYGFWGPPIRTGSRSELVQLQLSFRQP
ncbi:putative metallophosphoesterase [compost metagenome]